MLLKNDDSRLKRKIIVLLCIIYIISNGSAIITSTSEVSSLQQNVTFLLTNASDQDTRIINLESVSSDFLIFNLTSIAVIDGTLSDGSIISLEGYDDGISYNITEDSGANPLTFNMTFEGVTGFRSFGMRYNYQGGAGHEINVSIYDTVDGDWDMLLEITDTSGFVDTVVDFLQPEKYISGGIINIRGSHLGTGIASHQLFLDRAVVGIFTVSTGTHDGLSERENFASNHPAYAINLTQHETDVFNLWTNATDQDNRIISNEVGIVSLWTNATGQDNHITNLWTNASDQDTRIIALEAGGGGGGDRVPEWDTLNGRITSNSSIFGGDINVSGKNIGIGGNIHMNVSSGFVNFFSDNQYGLLKPFIEFSYDKPSNVSRLRWYNAGAMDAGDAGDNGRLDYFSRLYQDPNLRGVFRIVTPSRSTGESIHFMGGNDGGDYLKEYTSGNEVTLEVVSATGGANLYIKNASGGYATVHADAFTVHSTFYDGNESQAISDLESYAEGNHPERLSTEIIIVDEESCNINNAGDNICIPTVTHKENVGTDLSKGVTALVKYTKRNRNEGKRIRDRQYELISNLYDNGFLNQSQAINLRDNF